MSVARMEALVVLASRAGSPMWGHLWRRLDDDVVSRNLSSGDPRRAVLLRLSCQGALVHEAVTHVVQLEARHFLRTDLRLRDVLGKHVDIESWLLY